MNEVVIAHDVLGLEHHLKTFFTPLDLSVEHFFIPGVYVRVLHIPIGVVLTGKIHNHECINIMAKGRLAVSSNEGQKILVAGDVFHSGPGVKRAGFALEDTVYITVHRTDNTDTAILEDELVSESYEEYQRRLT